MPPTVYLLKSLHTGSFRLTWFSVLSPLLLLLPLCSYRIFRDEPLFIRTSQENYLSLSHVLENSLHALDYLFNRHGDYTNSVLLSTFGLVAIILFIVAYSSRILSFAKQRECSAVFYPALIVLLVNSLLALCNYWGDWTDPATSRFSLPLHLAMVICIALTFHRIFQYQNAPTWLLVISAGYFLFVSPTHCYRMQHEFRLNTALGYDWAMHWIREEAPPGNHLYIAESASGLGLLGVGAIPIMSANAMPERVALCKQYRLYDEVFFIEELTNRGDLPPTTLGHIISVNPRFQRASVVRKNLSTTRFYRISRLVELLPAEPGEETLPGNLPPPPPEDFATSNNLAAYYQALLPLAPSK